MAVPTTTSSSTTDTFNTNIDLFIQDIKDNRVGKGFTPKILADRQKRDDQYILDILEKQKEFNNALNEIPEEQVQADWNQTDNTQVDYIKNKPSISGGGTIEKRNAYDEPYSYCGAAPQDSLESDLVWNISRIEVFTDGSVDVTEALGVDWTNYLTHIYS